MARPGDSSIDDVPTNAATLLGGDCRAQTATRSRARFCSLGSYFLMAQVAQSGSSINDARGSATTEQHVAVA